MFAEYSIKVHAEYF